MNIAIYTFNSSTDTLPTFNNGYTYTYTDVDNGDGTITRTITSDELPTSISFSNKSGLVSVSELKTDEVTSMSQMFYKCSKLSSVDLSGWNTSKVIATNWMFDSCSSITTLNVSNFNTNSLTSMGGMFYNCSKLTSIEGLSNFDTSKVQYMQQLFYNCSNLTSLDLNGWDLNAVTMTDEMLRYCDKLTTINMTNNDVVSINKVINVLPNRTTSDYGTLNIGTITGQLSSNNNYWNIVSNTTLSKEIFKYTSNANISCVFNNELVYAVNDVINADGTVTRTITSDNSPTSITFANNTSITSLRIDSSDTSNITSIQRMFYGCSNLASIDLSNFDTSNVTTMHQMFDSCVRLTSIDLSSFNTSKVTAMSWMFSDCQRLQTINLSGWETNNLTAMGGMFYACPKLTSIEGLSNFDTSKVQYMQQLFYRCTNLESLDLNSWDLNAVTMTDEMFRYCDSLLSINMKNSDVASINKIITQLPTRTADSTGTLKIGTPVSSCDMETTNSKNWNIKSNFIVKYRFNTAKNSDYRPGFDSNFNNYYYIEDKDEGNGIILRTIKATTDDIRPTQMRFGNKSNYVPNHALLEILEIDTSSLTTMSEMFAYCLGLTSLSILSSFDTSNVTNMSYMFNYIPNNLAIGDYIRDWDTSKVTNMSYMFNNCSKLTSIDVSKWDVSKVINMESMFTGCSALTSLDVSNWRVPNVEYTSYMFYGCSNLTSVDVSNWGVSKVYNTSYMFYLCNKLTELDLSSWHTPFLEAMGEMFSYCNNLTKLNLCNWDLTYCQLQGYSILYNVGSIIKEIDLSNCSLLTVNKIIRMLPSKKLYGNAGGLIVSEDVAKKIDNNALIESENWSVIKTLIAEYVFDTSIDTYPNFSTISSGGGDYSYWYTYEDSLNADSTTRKIYTYNVVMPVKISFTDCEGLLSVQYLNTSNLKDMYGIFSKCTNLLSVNASDWDTSKVTNMSYAFNYCNKLTILDIANWDVSNAIRMYAMFKNCSSLTSLDLSNWDVGKVTDMSYMFYQCYSLMSLSLKYWNTKSVTSMYAMFRECSKLTSLDLSSFSTYNVTDMGSMFDSCESLTTLYLNNWNTNKVTSIANLIYNSKKLNYVNVINSDEDTVKRIQNYLPEKANLGDGALIIGDHIKKGIYDYRNWKVFKQTVKKNTVTSSMLKYLLNSLKNKFALKSEVDGKVDKVENKVLSTNDYTNDDYKRCKNVLSNLELKYTETSGYNYENYVTNMVLTFNNLNEEYYTSVFIAPEQISKFGIEIKDINKIKFTDINGIEIFPTLNEAIVDGPYIEYCYTYNNFLFSITVNTEIKVFSVNSFQPSLLEDEFNSRAVPSVDPFYIHIPKVVMVEIPFDKYRPSGLIVGCDTNFVCELDNEYRIYYKYASSIPYLYSSGKPYGKHTLVVETTRVDDPNAPDTKEYILDVTNNLNDLSNGGYVSVSSLQGVKFETINKVTMIIDNEPIIATKSEFDDGNTLYFADVYESMGIMVDLNFLANQNEWIVEFYTENDDFICPKTLSIIVEQKNKYVIKEELEYDYKDIPGYYSYIPNEKDTNITMYFIGVNGIETGKTYLKPSFKNFVLVYEFNTGQDTLPIFNSGFTNYIISDKTKTNSVERTLTSNKIPSSISFDTNFNLTKATYMTQSITNMSGVFWGCRNLKETYVYGNNITDVSNMYRNCTSLEKVTECGSNVTDMSYTYANCYSLIGPAVSGPNVTTMYNTYANCYNLTGSPVCGSNVTNMGSAYRSCSNLTGEPVCGDKVTNMIQAYYGCYNLTGEAICGPNVTNMLQTYYNCSNIERNSYFYSNDIVNVSGCFGKRNENRRLNLYVPNSGNTINTILHGENTTSSLIGEDILYTYVNDEYDPYYVNTNKNVYVYPVNNVAETYDQHKRLIVSYTAKNLSVLPGTITTSYGNAGYTTNVVGNKITLLKTDINAKITYISFYNNRNITGIRELSNTITNMASSFQNCTNLTGTPACGENVTNMAHTYENCYNLTGDFVCGDKVTNMYATYESCNKSTKNPVCGPNVIDMTWAYSQCLSITGSPVCGPNVVRMIQTYYNCYGLTGEPVCGPNVIDFGGAYSNCNRITGTPVCGDKVTNLSHTYNNCQSLTGQPACGSNVISMSHAYYNCKRITGQPACGPNVTDMSSAYNNCTNLTGQPVCGPNVIYMAEAYVNCHKLTGSPVCNNNVIYFNSAYYNCYNITGSPVCGNNVTELGYTYAFCYNLTGSPICGPNVTTLKYTYRSCQNLTGSPVCGDNVTDMFCTYYGCINLTGSPVCGPNVTNMCEAYYSCTNLTGNPVCGPNVTDFGGAYWDCHNITGSPVCGNIVTNMANAYHNCYKLTGRPVCGPNVTNMNYAYRNCRNLTGPVFVGQNVSYMANTFNGCNNIAYCNVYVTSPSVSNVSNSFYSSNSLNIYVPANSQTFNTFSLSSSGQAIKGGVFWNWINTGNYYYNNSYNFRIIPVNDVIQSYKENELSIVTYTTTNTAERPSSITGAVNGYGVLINGNNVKIYGNDENDIITYISLKNSQTITDVTSMTDSITNMNQSFYNCRNLTKAPICGNNVTTMNQAFLSCSNLRVPATIGFNVTTSWMTYCNCWNIGANAYFFSHKVNNAQSCFGLRDTSKRLNIYVPQKGYTDSYNTLGTCLFTNNDSLIGQNITWTNDITTNGYYYNTAQNIYIYPVDNAYQSYRENELLIARYTMYSNANINPIVEKRTVSEVIRSNSSYIRSDESYTINKFKNGNSFEEDFVSITYTAPGNNYSIPITKERLLEEYNGEYISTWTDEMIIKIKVQEDKTIKVDITYLGQSNPDDYFYTKISIEYYKGYEFNNKYSIEEISNSDNTITRSVYVKDCNIWPPYISFENSSGLLSVEKISTKDITSTSYLFSNCSNLTSINTENWDTSKILNADYMFYNCSKLTKDSFTNFELPNAVSASHIFSGCINLK